MVCSLFPFKMAKISTFRQRVVGVSNYAGAMEQYIAGQRVVLRRDSDNAYDKNAIEVLASGRRIGFISRDEAETFAPAMDKGDKVEAVIDHITGGIYSCLLSKGIYPAFSVMLSAYKMSSKVEKIVHRRVDIQKSPGLRC